jgi:hypothetical protein
MVINIFGYKKLFSDKDIDGDNINNFLLDGTPK